MLGVIIGVASVVTVVSVGEGVKQQISNATDRLGKDLITIRPGRLSNERGLPSLASFGSLTGVSNNPLSAQDLGVVQKTPGVGVAAPLSVVARDVVSGETRQPYTGPVIGTTSAFPAILRQSLAYGAFCDDQSATDKVVIGQHVVRALYGENVPL